MELPCSRAMLLGIERLSDSGPVFNVGSLSGICLFEERLKEAWMIVFARTLQTSAMHVAEPCLECPRLQPEALQPSTL